MRLSIYLNKRGVYRVNWVERKKEKINKSFLVSICVAYNRIIIIITICSWGMIMVPFLFIYLISMWETRYDTLRTVR